MDRFKQKMDAHPNHDLTLEGHSSTMIIMDDGSVAQATTMEGDDIEITESPKDDGRGSYNFEEATNSIEKEESFQHHNQNREVKKEKTLKSCVICQNVILLDDPTVMKDILEDFSSKSITQYNKMIASVIGKSYEDISFTNKVICVECTDKIDKMDELQEQIKEILKELHLIKEDLRTKIFAATNDKKKKKFTPQASFNKKRDTKNCDDSLDKTKNEKKKMKIEHNVVKGDIIVKTEFHSDDGDLYINETSKKQKCKLCGKCFPNQPMLPNNISIMKLHWQDAHPEELELHFVAKDKEVKKKKDRNVKASCEFCGEMYSRYQLAYHINDKHLHTKVYNCIHCEATFDTLNRKKAHQRAVHKKEKKHVCHLCGGKYEKDSLLMKHIKVFHEGKREHICEICGQDFKYPNGLRQHINKVHLQLRKYRCKLCGKTFKCGSGCKKHLKVVHHIIGVDTRLNSPFLPDDMPLEIIH